MSQYAYVTVLYGNNIYVTGALVLGYSLMKTNTQYDRVILVTSDVDAKHRTYLNKIYTHIINIDYININPTILIKEDTRFRDVFTKLQALSLVQYDKIILLDLDMIVARNIDHLFKLRPPSACLKRFYVPYGKLIPKHMICRNDQLVGSINAGLMLLEPDQDELESIKKEVLENKELRKYRYPEQDYLSLRYCGDWTSITFNYNFQFGLTDRVRKCKYKIEDIYVIHYSSSHKPWNYLLPNHVENEEEEKFKDMHHKYYVIWKNAYTVVRNKLDYDLGT